MQAIQTKYLPATSCKGSRIKAWCERGSITIDYPHDLSGDAVHIAAADALVAKFVKEDALKYGTHKNPWEYKRACGGLPDGSMAHVYLHELENAVMMHNRSLSHINNPRDAFTPSQMSAIGLNPSKV